MAKRKHDDAAVTADEFHNDEPPRQLISLGEHVDVVPDITPRIQTKQKKGKRARKHKKSKRNFRDSTDDERSTDDEDP